MITAKPHELELLKFWLESDPTAGIRINFPIDAQTGAASTAAVNFELAPVQHIGTHTHSAEEILFVLEGEAEAVVGGEREGSLRRRWRWCPPTRPRPIQRRRGYTAGGRLLLQRGGSEDLRSSLAPLDTKVPPRSRSASSRGIRGQGRSTFHWAGVTIIPGPSSCSPATRLSSAFMR
jgi:hypothetical protein